jgi:hypothetical protein
MKKRMLMIFLAVSALVLPAVGQAKDRGKSQKGPWIHVEVLEDGAEGAKVKLNLPLSMARAALDLAPKSVMSDHEIEINGRDYDVTDLRKLWKELRDTGDADFVTIEDDGDHVKISRQGNRIFVDARENDGESVHIEVPVALVDALLAGTSDELDYEAALAELEGMSGEIVRVDGDHETVRVWIE